MLLGSEGILGVITDAWVRVQERPTAQALGRRRLRRLRRRRRGGAGDLAVGPLPGQLPPARRGRVRDHRAPGPPGKALLVLGFESAHHPVDGPMADRAGRRAGARRRARRGPGQGRVGRRASEEGRRRRRLAERLPAAPYLRDSMVACGVLSDTFETAITWDRFPDFHAEVMETARRAVAEASGAPRRGQGLAADQLPLHPCLSGRAGALLHGARPGQEGQRGRAVGRDQGRRLRRRDRRRRDHHPPPRGRARPPALV